VPDISLTFLLGRLKKLIVVSRTVHRAIRLKMLILAAQLPEVDVGRSATGLGKNDSGLVVESLKIEVAYCSHSTRP
jgi:hypothetical protein